VEALRGKRKAKRDERAAAAARKKANQAKSAVVQKVRPCARVRSGSVCAEWGGLWLGRGGRHQEGLQAAGQGSEASLLRWRAEPTAVPLRPSRCGPCALPARCAADPPPRRQRTPPTTPFPGHQGGHGQEDAEEQEAAEAAQDGGRLSFAAAGALLAARTPCPAARLGPGTRARMPACKPRGIAIVGERARGRAPVPPPGASPAEPEASDASVGGRGRRQHRRRGAAEVGRGRGDRAVSAGQDRGAPGVPARKT
jgi:hypothetical protein